MLSFNPSLVRLAPAVPPGTRSRRRPFQSQLGSIGALHPSPRLGGRPAFQSQLGSIGARVPRCQRDGREDFQSQLGSIGARPPWRSNALHRPLSIPAWFDWPLAQSRGGGLCPPLSIPAWFDWRLIAGGNSPARRQSFNPSLVRLAQTQEVPSLPNCQTFNPSLVRLARLGRRICADRAAPFQSQLGSIGAPKLHGRQIYPQYAFNPSLVRLAPS